jgi:hypothetical protein
MRRHTPITVWNTRDAFNSEASELTRTTEDPEYQADTLYRDLPEAEQEPNPAQADALRRAFGTRPARRLRPAGQDELFNPHPQRRLF